MQTRPASTRGPRTFAQSILNPTGSDDIRPMFRTSVALNVTRVYGGIIGLTNATFTIEFDTTLPAAGPGTGTEIITGGTLVTAGAGTDESGVAIDVAAIPAGSWVYIVCTAKTGSPLAVIGVLETG